MAETYYVTYGRTFNLGNFESLRIEVQEPVLDQGPEGVINIAAYRVLSMAREEIKRIRDARSKVSASLGPEPIIEFELTQLGKILGIGE
jgi:hypothetical protein